MQIDKNGNPLSELKVTQLIFRLERSNEQDILVPVPFDEDYLKDPKNLIVIDEVPVFPGCESVKNRKICFQKKMKEHIVKHYRYPKKAARNNISGRVNIMFIIEKDGSIKYIRTFGAPEILMNEARRIIQKLPKMSPGKQSNKTVRVPFSIPITFRL